LLIKNRTKDLEPPNPNPCSNCYRGFLSPQYFNQTNSLQ
jgi:hypothetical protein